MLEIGIWEPNQFIHYIPFKIIFFSVKNAIKHLSIIHLLGGIYL